MGSLKECYLNSRESKQCREMIDTMSILFQKHNVPLDNAVGILIRMATQLCRFLITNKIVTDSKEEVQALLHQLIDVNMAEQKEPEDMQLRKEKFSMNKKELSIEELRDAMKKGANLPPCDLERLKKADEGVDKPPEK